MGLHNDNKSNPGPVTRNKLCTPLAIADIAHTEAGCGNQVR